MGICKNQYTFVKDNALINIGDANIEMLELGDKSYFLLKNCNPWPKFVPQSENNFFIYRI